MANFLTEDEIGALKRLLPHLKELETRFSDLQAKYDDLSAQFNRHVHGLYGEMTEYGRIDGEDTKEISEEFKAR